jgi:hypothetical protein
MNTCEQIENNLELEVINDKLILFIVNLIKNRDFTTIDKEFYIGKFITHILNDEDISSSQKIQIITNFSNRLMAKHSMFGNMGNFRMEDIGSVQDIELIEYDENKIFLINQFDIEKQLKSFNCPKILIIGMSGSGKSWLVRDIMSHYQDIPTGKIIAPTDKLVGFYKNIIDEKYIEYKCDDYASKLTDDNEQFLILDDCQSIKSAWLNDVVFNSCSLKLNPLIITVQYSNGIRPEQRAKFDYIFILGEDFVINKRKLYDHYCGFIKTFEEFDKIFDKTTNDFSCLVINNKLKSKNVNDKLFKYKAEKIEDFKLCNN